MLTHPRRATAVLLLAALPLGHAAAQSDLRLIGQATWDNVSEVAVTALGPERAVTATRNALGLPEVTSWHVSEGGTVERLDHNNQSVGPASRIAVAPLGRGRVLTAMRADDGSLRLVTWDIALANGAVTRAGTRSSDETVYHVAVAGLGVTRAVTALEGANHALRLISWRVDSVSGAITQLDAASGGPISLVAIAPLSASRVATAVRQDDGTLKVIVWDLDVAGHFARRGSATAGPIAIAAGSPVGGSGALSMVRLRTGRVATAVRTRDSTLEVRTWTVARDGDVTPRSVATAAGPVSAVALTTRAATQLLAAVRQTSGIVTLMTWNGVGDLTRTRGRDVAAGDLVAVTTLGTDRLVTATRQANDPLRVMAWRDDAVSLLHGTWGPQGGVYPTPVPEIVAAGTADAEPSDDDAAEIVTKLPPGGGHDLPATEGTSEGQHGADSPPLAAPPFRTEIEGNDPMIAVGHTYLVVTQNGRIRFYDKTGALLPKKLGYATDIKTYRFFGGFLADTMTDGSVNEENINRHLNVEPAAGAPDCEDVSQWSTQPPCLNEFYDTRVSYDRVSRRFVIASAVRSNIVQSMAYHGDSIRVTDPQVRRFLAIAVSRTEDPRDGWYQWITTETNYSDWPRMTAQDGVLMVAANSYQTDPWRDGPKPVAYVFPLDSLRLDRLRPPSHKIFATETGGRVSPVVNLEPTPGHWHHFLRLIDTGVELYSFRTPADVTTMPPLAKSVANVGVLPTNVGAFAMRRGGFLYITGQLQSTPRVPNVRTARYRVRLMRYTIPSTSAGTPTVSAAGYLDTSFGIRAPSDAPNDLVSYEVPAMSVTRDGDMVFVYGRAQVQTTAPLFPEARYSVYYADSRGLQRSRLLQAGNFQPRTLWKTETDTTAVTFNAPKTLDFSTAAIDPADDQTVWMAHAYADSINKDNKNARLTMVVGRVKPVRIP